MLWLDKYERKLGKFGIKNLMLYITTLNGIVYLLMLLDSISGNSLQFADRIALIPSMVLHGEVWRLLTFLFVPPPSSPVLIIFALYFYYMIGSSLEREWGAFRFNVYYLIGVLGTIASAFLGGAGSSMYLNLSLIFAFSYVFPNYEIMLFFLVPVKMKYLSIFYAAFLLYSFAFNPLAGLITILGSALNFILFFGADIFLRVTRGRKTYYNKKDFQKKIPKIYVMHRCTVCGKTNVEDRNMEFRYCMDCDGDREYCMDHLYTHEHIKDGEKHKS